ncbi:hypothetical protein SDC9_105187 [bioreactor metagenome]|uniref:PucR C-terminal helix-turn-helix domain-containing protein n=1 Tax=bioreactor metagenome TaxID=1076179 RepID=A0A645AZY9_9ZZZZ
MRRNDCNCLFFDQEIGLAAIFNETVSILRRFRDWDHAMDLAIARSECLQKLVDLCEPLTQGPIVIWNNSFEIQAYSRNRAIERPQLQKVLKAGHFSGEELDILVRMNYLRESDQYATLKLCYPPNWMNCPFALRLFMEGQKSVVGMVQYFLDCSPTLGQLEFLHMIESKLEQYVARNLKTGHRAKTFFYEPFLIALLDGHLSRREEIQDRVKAINLPYEAKYRVYQLCFEKFTPALASYAASNCKSIFPSSKIVEHHGGLCILDREGAKGSGSSSEAYRRENLLNLLEICGACCGVSDVVPDLGGVRAAYLQTQSALEVRRVMAPEQRIMEFQDAFFWDMLGCYTQQRALDLKLLYYRPLDVLMENDRATGNDNLRLLDIYLNNDRNITNTAKEMNLHRNSVIYRLERIEQMLGGSLAESELRFKLLVSLRILSYVGKKEA